MTVQELNAKYAIEGYLTFVESKGNIAIAMIGNDHALAQVSLYGAHVMSFEPADQDDVLMMSAKSSFVKGKPMRGGIPLCFPWFGPHPTDAAKPPHGFARLSDWTVKGASQLSDGSTQLVLTLSDSDNTRKEWPYAFLCEMTIVVGPSLKMTWTITNKGADSFETAPAFHTYFATNDIAQVSVKGLEGATYLDATKQLAPTVEGLSAIVIDSEVNRCYMDTEDVCTIVDKSLDRTVTIAKTGSKSTVLWNPWEATAKNIGDLGDDEYLDFLCLETANVHYNKLKIEAGQSHTMSVEIAVK